jgi:hypothetical protein
MGKIGKAAGRNGTPAPVQERRKKGQPRYNMGAATAHPSPSQTKALPL